MITCKRATELISKAEEEPLTKTEELSLRLHLFLCEFCEQFRKQLQVLRHGLKRLEEEKDHLEESVSEIPIPKGAKERLRKKLQKQDSSPKE